MKNALKLASKVKNMLKNGEIQGNSVKKWVIYTCAFIQMVYARPYPLDRQPSIPYGTVLSPPL